MKENIKKYKSGAIDSTIAQIRCFVKNKKVINLEDGTQLFEPDIVNVCYELLLNATEKEKYYFVRVFNQIITLVSTQFMVLPMYLRDVYKDMYADKLKKMYENAIKGITNTKLRTHLNCLYSAYVHETVLKDWRRFIKQHPYINPHFPYDVKQSEDVCVF